MKASGMGEKSLNVRRAPLGERPGAAKTKAVTNCKAEKYGQA
jgi:hypothetical protein